MWLVWREVVCFKSPVLWAGCLAGAPVPFPRNQGNQRRHQQELPVQNLLPVRPPHFGCIRGQGPPGWVLVISDEQMHPCFCYSAASERRLQRSYLVTITTFLLRMSLAWHCLAFSYFFFFFLWAEEPPWAQVLESIWPNQSIQCWVWFWQECKTASVLGQVG